MKLLVLAVTLAFVLAASAQVLFGPVPPAPVPFYSVSEADLVCQGDADCTTAPLGCCPESHCSATAVNTASAQKYTDMNVNLTLTYCPGVCTMNMCMSWPNATCVKPSAASVNGYCTLAGVNTPVTHVPTVVESPQAPSVCQKTGCSGEICAKESMISTCELTCEKMCYAAATCTSTSSGTCQFVMDFTLKTCLAGCGSNNLTSVTAPVSQPQCKIGGCGMSECVPVDSVAPGECPKFGVSCRDQCHTLYGSCGPSPVMAMLGFSTSSGCAWGPSDAHVADYADCLAKCGTTIPGDDMCVGLSCADCTAKAGCSFCEVSYSTTAEGASSPVTSSVGACVGSFGQTVCAATSVNGVVTSSTACPAESVPGSTGGAADGVNTEVADPTVFQAGVEGSGHPVTTKFTVVIAMVVNLTSSNSNVANVVKLFVDLLGSQTPTQQDKDDVCAILRSTLTKIDDRIPVASINCQLDLQTTVKRDVRYVASLSYPSSNNIQNGSATSLIASFAAVAIAALVALF